MNWNSLLAQWGQPTRAKRILLFLLFDVVVVLVAFYGAFWLRFDSRIPTSYLTKLPLMLGLAILLKLPIFYLQRFYRMSWSYVGLNEVITIFKGVAYGSLLFGTASFIFRESDLFLGFPRSILLIDFALTLVLIGGGRMLKRVYLQLRQKPLEGVRTLIVGAGNAGEQLVRSMQQEVNGTHVPVAFVDDDPAKRGLNIHGYPVLGNCGELSTLVKRHEIGAVFIAMPSATSSVIRRTVDLVRQANVPHIKVLPPLSEIFSGKVETGHLREVNLEDLLGRTPVKIDTQAVQTFLQDKVVLITGAAGSIGSELSRQVARFSPAQLIALDQDETGVFYLEKQLHDHFPSLDLVSVIANVKERQKLSTVFEHYHPNVVFHAAAYKHVGLMERFPEEAIQNNVLGTQVVAEAALDYDVEKFVLISTDKAVNPTSVMGVTKRLAETLIVTLNKRGKTQFSAVRFGNVLGSRGSVVPIFENQIRQRGPVTVTHPKMRRYFMITSEAVLLVLQAGAMGQGGEVFVLDMGEPVKIVDLARELILLHGFEPDKDIPIVFTQPKPGEKLDEELLTAEEGTQTTHHERVFQAQLNSQISEEELKTAFREFEQGSINTREAMTQWLKNLVPEFQPHDDHH